jgi:hypothetical protein
MPTQPKRGATYSSEAIDFCRRLYVKYFGKQHDRIEKEMHRAGWTGWRKINLHGRKRKGEGRGETLGWIEKYGFDTALDRALVRQPTAALNTAQDLVNKIDAVLGQLDRQVSAKGANIDDESFRVVQLHRDYCKLKIDALTRVEAAKDTLGGWVSFWERLIDWAPDIDIKLARLMVKHSDQIIARAEQEFGEEMNVNPNENQANPAANAGTED